AYSRDPPRISRRNSTRRKGRLGLWMASPSSFRKHTCGIWTREREGSLAANRGLHPGTGPVGRRAVWFGDIETRPVSGLRSGQHEGASHGARESRVDRLAGFSAAAVDWQDVLIQNG